MKVYLSVPMVAYRELSRATVMARAISDSGNELTSPWVLGPLEVQSQRTANIFQRDRLGAEGSDILVADVSQPSIGVGMEIMAAYKANRRIILAAKRGSVVSRMLLQMEGKELIEFDGVDDLHESLKRILAPG